MNTLDHCLLAVFARLRELVLHILCIVQKVETTSKISLAQLRLGLFQLVSYV